FVLVLLNPRHPLQSTLVPYTTLFRSRQWKMMKKGDVIGSTVFLNVSKMAINTSLLGYLHSARRRFWTPFSQLAVVSRSYPSSERNSFPSQIRVRSVSMLKQIQEALSHIRVMSREKS